MKVTVWLKARGVPTQMRDGLLEHPELVLRSVSEDEAAVLEAVYKRNGACCVKVEPDDTGNTTNIYGVWTVDLSGEAA